ncbi:GTP-binding protein Era [Denitrovibrio acetiphilus DSM 12809]|uniref:GTPase Era n=1 Tax=Denitrovibrio acetiphilus (strain DSM 12809 / NBRC 114555 / N2460) TaxID=522772 RepID=D4H8E5_DENA2|nr:GTPase Era [Denitrovibrio acetiphilus]ADD68294.1 GTP-binding protein Era [Denitrovibrio acetiphilus DSM 12809]
MKKFKTGFISIMGRPNVGKSTLLNALMGEKIAITSSKPQTTRANIQGILTGEDFQLIFIDTPGYHKAKDSINKMMVQQAKESLEAVDAIYVLVQPDEFMGPELTSLIKVLEKTDAVKFLIINKVDHFKKELVYDMANKMFPMLEFKHVLPVSALKGTNVAKLLELTLEEMEEGEPVFPADEVTTQPEKLLVAEFIREQVFRQLSDEIPYQIVVETEKIEDRSDDLMYIAAAIIVNRDSQKGVVIGKGGQRLKEISTASRVSLSNFFGVKIYLELFVKVKTGWQTKDEYLRMQGLY